MAPALVVALSLTALAGSGGSGGCNPFEFWSAWGTLYTYAQAGSNNDATKVPLSLAALLGGGAACSSSAGPPGASTSAQANSSLSLLQGDFFGMECSALGHAQAAGSSAFARSDINSTVVLTLPETRRVQGYWELHGSGISDLSVTLKRIDPWVTAVNASVSTYITPQTISGTVRLVLPADSYQLQVHGSLQANVSFLNPNHGEYGGYLYLACIQLADVDFDGSVTANDLSALLAAWGPAPPFATTDLNQDGAVDSADLLILLAAW